MKKLPLLVSSVFFILLCVSGSYWALQLIHPAVRKVAAPQLVKPVADVESVATLFGGAMAVASNYQLKGIVSANPMNQSVAIIAVDGKPTQAYPMNSEISNGVKLSEVHSMYILLIDNGVSKRVELSQESKASGTIAPIARNSPASYLNGKAAGNLGLNRDEPNGGNARPRGDLITRPPLPQVTLPSMPLQPQQPQPPQPPQPPQQASQSPQPAQAVPNQ